ncbi:MAG TPA: phosphate ABC transporter substrate-binding protein PstS [Acidimicrobiales bacterium]|nr:phosphate ABC transporter substrate-binding protein PstS [Acidimicrobiales bacterium]
MPEEAAETTTVRRTRSEGRPWRLVARVGVPVVAVGLLASACSSGPTTASPPAITTTAAAAAAKCTSSAPGGVLSTACDTRATTAQLSGAGANSISPFFTRAFYDYNKADGGVTVNYTPAGSSVGVTDIEQSTVQFGDSEVPIPVPASGSGGAILQLPVDLGGVALSYNLPGVGTGLKLDGPTLAGIFLGKITKWNDSAIAALNPKVKLPDLAIVAVHRADSSGPGYDLDQYLIDTGGSAWTAAVGTKASTHWPVTNVGVGEQLNTGLATYVQQTAGAIGYVEYAYALEAKFTNVAVKNASGAFVVPTQTSIAAAASSATGLSASKFNIVNGPGATTYPLANLSWTLIDQKQTSTATAVALGHLFDWVTTTEQKEAAALGYSPLPADAVQLAHQTLLQMETSSGAAVFTG